MTGQKYETRFDFLEGTIARFWSYVDRGEPDECWQWKGTLALPNNSGQRYGSFGSIKHGKPYSVRAHRFSYFLANGKLPEVVMHTCDTPGCVNPDHLRGGTHYDNAQDRTQKWRTDQGEQHYAAKLKPEQVLEIFDNKTDTAADLEKRYGVHNSHIIRIQQGKKWKRLLAAHGRIKDPRGTPATDQQTLDE